MIFFFLLSTLAAEPWQTAPKPIHDLLQNNRPPTARISVDNQSIWEFERPNLPPISDLQAPIERLAGRKLDPNTNGPSRASYYTGLRRVSFDNTTVDELPIGSDRFTYFSASPDGSQAFYTELSDDGYRLWLIDFEDFSIQKLSKQRLNASYGNPCVWRTDRDILCKVIPEDRGSPPTLTTIGPRIEENNGESKPVRTYTNLLQSQLDIEKFDYYFNSEIWEISTSGISTRLLDNALYQRINPSPDGEYILISELQKPWSTTVPLSRFAKKIYVADQDGKIAYEVADLPLADNINTAFNSVRTGKRTVDWRSDKDATLWWVEAMDDGDARKDVKKRDALFILPAPFTIKPIKVMTTELRFYNVMWGTDTMAIVQSYWYDSRTLREWKINPKKFYEKPQLLIERDYQDAYADPGSILTKRDPRGEYRIQYTSDGQYMYRSGKGASPEGVFPFLDKCPITGEECSRVWQAKGENYESFVKLLDDDGTRFITSYQDPSTPKNLYLHQPAPNEPTAITHYKDHMPELAGLQKQLIQYKRKDGVQLSATLYLPPKYNKDKDGPLPTLLWAYPSEFKSAASAGQIRNSPWTFSRPAYSSVLFLLTQGYAVVVNPTMPIIGEGDQEPNDDYVNQLVMGAEAAVNHLVEMGVSDRRKMAIGGHSYGAFTTANLLAHTDLFQAGIARSGAYNRTLTPFGFQSEQRTFWENSSIYYSMSPFMQADKINEPILLIHGADDPNAGTYPMQSKRMFEALKGLGATVRWVELPYEEHGYRSQEAVEHVHWEMVNWLNNHVQ